MKSLKQILAENMLRFNSKNLTDEDKARILHEAVTYDAMGLGAIFPFLPTNIICKIGTPIDIMASAEQWSPVTPFTFTAVSFTPSDAGKLMGFDTKSVTAKGSVPAAPILRSKGRVTDETVSAMPFYSPSADPQVLAFIKSTAAEMEALGARWFHSPHNSSWKLPPSEGKTWKDIAIKKVYQNLKIGTITPTTIRPKGNQKLLQNLNAADFAAYAKASPAPFNKYKPDPNHFDPKRGVMIGRVTFNTNSQGSDTQYGGQVNRPLWFMGSIVDAPGAAPVTPTTNPGQ